MALSIGFNIGTLPLTQLVLTAYDIEAYMQEALPALKAAIYRCNLSPAKDLLATHDDMLVDEWHLNDILPGADHSWIFTDACVDVEAHDPAGDLINLTYPLILLYHHPDLCRLTVPGAEFDDTLPFPADFGTGLPGVPGSDGLIQPGYREGLRAMWEIVGFVGVEDTRRLQQVCAALAEHPSTQPLMARGLARLAQSLTMVVQQGFGLVLERESQTS